MKKKSKIGTHLKPINNRCRYGICLPSGVVILLEHKPKKIAGGYMTKYGKRYIGTIHKPFLINYPVAKIVH